MKISLLYFVSVELEKEAYWEQNSTKDFNILQWNSSWPQFLLTQLLDFYLDYIQDYDLTDIKLEEIRYSTSKTCCRQKIFTRKFFLSRRFALFSHCSKVIYLQGEKWKLEVVDCGWFRTGLSWLLLMGEDCAGFLGNPEHAVLGKAMCGFGNSDIMLQWDSESLSSEFLFINSELYCRFQLIPSSLSLWTLSLSRCLQRSLLPWLLASFMHKGGWKKLASSASAHKG